MQITFILNKDSNEGSKSSMDHLFPIVVNIFL